MTAQHDRNRYVVQVAPLDETPLKPLAIASPFKRDLTRIRFRDQHRSELLRSRYGFVTRWDETLGMFWVWVPTLEPAYGKRYEFGPFMRTDIGRRMDIAERGHFRRPNASQFKRFAMTSNRAKRLAAKIQESTDDDTA